MERGNGRPLTDVEIEQVARNEVPELTRQLTSVPRLVARLQSLNSVDRQHDLDGLHDVVDRALATLVTVHRGHPGVAALAEFVEQFPDMRPPLFTKVALVSLLA